MEQSSKPTLLIVDDDQPNLTIFRALYMRKFNILTATSGPEGLEQLKENDDVRICFSDLKMPRMDGLEFVNLAREDYPNISYVILSGSDLGVTLENALDEGVIDGYIHKPFDAKDLDDMIDKFLPPSEE